MREHTFIESELDNLSYFTRVLTSMCDDAVDEAYGVFVTSVASDEATGAKWEK